MHTYIMIKAGNPCWSLPLCGITYKENMLLRAMATKYIPKREKKYSLKEFVTIIDKTARDSRQKVELLQWLGQMV